MRIAPDTSIHDLTDVEAADLRALCEAMLGNKSAGPASTGRALFLAWADVVCPEHEIVGATGRMRDMFLPRALHALLRRVEHGEPLRMIGDGSLVRLTITTPDEWKDPLP